MDAPVTEDDALDAVEEITEIMQKDATCRSLIRRFGSCLGSAEDLGKQSKLSGPCGTVISLRGGIPHRAPPQAQVLDAERTYRCVLFCTSRLPDSPVPKYDPNTQYQAAVLVVEMLALLWPKLSVPIRICFMHVAAAYAAMYKKVPKCPRPFPRPSPIHVPSPAPSRDLPQRHTPLQACPQRHFPVDSWTHQFVRFLCTKPALAVQKMIAGISTAATPAELTLRLQTSSWRRKRTSPARKRTTPVLPEGGGVSPAVPVQRLRRPSERTRRRPARLIEVAALSPPVMPVPAPKRLAAKRKAPRVQIHAPDRTTVPVAKRKATASTERSQQALPKSSRSQAIARVHPNKWKIECPKTVRLLPRPSVCVLQQTN